MLIRIFSPDFSTEPQRLARHSSMRTLPLFSSVAQTPNGVVGAGAAATGAGCGAGVATAAGVDVRHGEGG
jgi:hypothetical protein